MTLQRYELGEVYDSHEGEHKACLTKSVHGSWIHMRDIQHLLENKLRCVYNDKSLNTIMRESKVDILGELIKELQ